MLFLKSPFSDFVMFYIDVATCMSAYMRFSA